MQRLARRLLPTLARPAASYPRRRLLSSEPSLARQVAAADLATQEAVLAALPADAKKQAGLRWLVDELEEEFTRADINTDGTLSYKEFQLWAQEVIERKNAPGEVKVPATGPQLRALGLQTMVPYMGFGMVDNSLMILSGTSESPREVVTVR